MNFFVKLAANAWSGAVHGIKSTITSLSSMNALRGFIAQQFGSTNVARDPFGNLVSWVWFAIHSVAQRVSRVPLQLYKLNPNGEVEELFDHELLALLARTNPTMTQSQLIYLSVIYLYLFGSSPWFLERAGKRIVNLWPMRPDLLVKDYDKSGRIIGYEYRVGADSAKYKLDEVLYIRIPNAQDPRQGFSLVMASALDIDTDLAAALWQKFQLENAAEPGGILQTTDEMTDVQKQQAIDGWNARFKGAGNIKRIAVLDKGLKYEKVGQTGQELDYVNSRALNRDAILTQLGIPTSLIDPQANRANADTAELVIAKNTIDPLINLITEHISEFLVPEFDQNLWMSYVSPVQEDTAEKRLDNQAAVNVWKTVNEVRADYNLAPLEGGDVLYMSFGLVPTIGAGASDEVDPNRNNTEDSKSVDSRTRIFVKQLGYKSGVKFLSPKMRQIKSRIMARTYMRRSITEKVAEKVAVKLFEILQPAQKQEGANRIVSIKAKSAEDEEPDDGLGFIDPGYDDKTLPDPIRAERKQYLKIRLPQHIRKMRKTVKTYFQEQKELVIKNLIEAGEPKAAIGIDTKAADYEVKKKDYIDKVIFDRKKQIAAMVKVTRSNYEDAIEDGGRDMAQLLGFAYEDIIANPRSVDFMATKPIKMAGEVNDYTIRQLRATLSDGIAASEGIGQLTDRVRQVYDGADDFRAERIARTESGSALNFGRDEEMGTQGVEQKMWICIFSNSRADHEDAHGQIVDTGSVFDVGGEDMEYPQDPAGSAANVVNCQCSVSPYIKK